MKKLKPFIFISCLCCFILAFSACGKEIIPPSPTKIIMEIKTSATINPDIKKIPSPLVVRFYQLKSQTRFNEADFISIYANDKQVLGEDLVHRQEVLLSPSDHKYINFETEESVKYISCLATFRQHNQGRWRASVKVEEHKTTTILISISGTNIEMTRKP